MSWRYRFVYRPQIDPTYRNLQSWVHFCLIAISGFVNLFYAGIIPILQKAIGDANSQGLSDYFKDADPAIIFHIVPLGILHTVIAISGLVISIASLDELKNRLLNTGPVKPN